MNHLSSPIALSTVHFSTRLAAALLALAAAGACKGDAKKAEPAAKAEAPAVTPAAPTPAPATTPAAAPAAAPKWGKLDPGLNIAVAIPATSKYFATNTAQVDQTEGGKDLAAVKQWLSAEGGAEESSIVGDEKLADGVLVRYRNGALNTALSYRTIGGGSWMCQPNGADEQPAVDLAIATCLGMVSDGTSVFVPFVFTGDGVSITTDGGNLDIFSGVDDERTDVATATQNAKNGLKILQQTPVPGGFAVAYQSFNGGIESQGLMYRALTRSKIGALDVMCESGGGVKAPEGALHALEMCRSLRAP